MRVLAIVTIACNLWVSQYAPGVMQRVIATRQAGLTAYNLGSVESVDGYAAAILCAEIGSIVYLRPRDTVKWEKFLIVDCSGDYETTSWMRRNGIPYEIDYESVLRWGERLGRNLVGRGIKIDIGMERLQYEFE
jgi:hypothetical protein